MNKPKRCLLLSLAIVCIVARVQAQPLRDEVEEAREAIKGIIAYPPETRLAILEICKEPKLIVEMSRSGKLPDLAGYPESVQNAAKELIQYPEVLRILCSRIGICAIVGRLYARSSGETLGIADKLAQAMEKQEETKKETWIELLKSNQEALEEFADAVEALAQAQSAQGAGTASPAQTAPPVEGQAPPETAPAEEPAPATPETYYQAEVSGNQVAIYSGPTGEMVDYLLANADQYAAAAAAALKYWQQYPVGAVAQSIASDLNDIASVADLINDPGLLREVGKLRKEFPNAKDRLTENRERVENIAGRRDDFPKLSRRVDDFGEKNPKQALNEWRKNPRSTPRATQRPRTEPRRRNKPGPASVRSADRNKQQRIGAGAHQHKNAWKGASGGRGSVGGGRGGGRGGGGRRR